MPTRLLKCLIKCSSQSRRGLDLRSRQYYFSRRWSKRRFNRPNNAKSFRERKRMIDSKRSKIYNAKKSKTCVPVNSRSAGSSKSVSSGLKGRKRRSSSV